MLLTPLGSFAPLSLGRSLSPGKWRQPAGGSGTGRDQDRGAPFHHAPPQGSASPVPTRVSLRSSTQRKGVWKQCGIKGLRSFQQQSLSSRQAEDAPLPTSREPNPRLAQRTRRQTTCTSTGPGSLTSALPGLRPHVRAQGSAHGSRRQPPRARVLAYKAWGNLLQGGGGNR